MPLLAKELAKSDLWPPLSSVRFSFQVFPRATLNSNPSRTPHPSGGAKRAFAPGNKVENMEPKSLFTCNHTHFTEPDATWVFMIFFFLLVAIVKNEWVMGGCFTFCHATLRASFFFWSNSSIVSRILALSFSTILFFFFRSLYWKKADSVITFYK